MPRVNDGGRKYASSRKKYDSKPRNFKMHPEETLVRNDELTNPYRHIDTEKTDYQGIVDFITSCGDSPNILKTITYKDGSTNYTIDNEMIGGGSPILVKDHTGKYHTYNRERFLNKAQYLGNYIR